MARGGGATEGAATRRRRPAATWPLGLLAMARRPGLVAAARRPGLVAAAFLFVSLLGPAGCSRPSEPSSPAAGAATSGRAPADPRDRRFVHTLAIEPATLNFVSGSDQVSIMVERLVADFLVDHDAALRTVPRLAASWEHSPDGRVLTFHLRSGVRFHDGAPLTSDDVVFTWERIMDPASRAVGRVDAFLSVEKVEALDPLTVKVTYREPFAPALRGWEIPILPAHLYRGVDFATAPANRSPVGTGPFRFVSWEAGRRIVLEANRDYWAGPPGLEQFVFAIIPSMDTAFEALLAREVDYARVPSTRVASPGTVPAAERGYQEMRYTPQFFYYIAWRGDGSNPFFADPRVRRALGAALDREGYIRTVLKGLGEMVTSPFTALQPATSLAPADSDTQAHAQALPQARANTPPEDPAALLDAAGWKRDPATGMRRRGTTPFRFTLLVFSGGEDHLQFSQVAQENLRRLGVDMRIERLDWQTLWSRLKSGDFQAALSGFVPQADPDSLYGLLHSTQIHGGQNYAAYRDPEVDAWLEAGRRTLDEPARAALYRRVEERIATQQPYAFLFAPVIVAGVSLRYEGAVISPQGIVGHMPGAWALRPARGGS